MHNIYLLFNYLDLSQTGAISELDFAIVFQDRKDKTLKSVTKSSLNFKQALNTDIYQQIENLFNDIDSDKSGFIETKEFKTVLKYLGINKIDNVEEYF